MFHYVAGGCETSPDAVVDDNHKGGVLVEGLLLQRRHAGAVRTVTAIISFS